MEMQGHQVICSPISYNCTLAKIMSQMTHILISGGAKIYLLLMSEFLVTIIHFFLIYLDHIHKYKYFLSLSFWLAIKQRYNVGQSLCFLKKIQSTPVISTSSGLYKKCRDIRMSTTVYWRIQSRLTLYKCACLTYKHMEDICSCPIIIVWVNVINS